MVLKCLSRVKQNAFLYSMAYYENNFVYEKYLWRGGVVLSRTTDNY